MSRKKKKLKKLLKKFFGYAMCSDSPFLVKDKIKTFLKKNK